MLHCTLRVTPSPVSGEPVRLRFSLANRSDQPLALLTWGTPFEGWWSPFVALHFGDQELPYQGPMAKRGEPGADEVLRILPGRSRRAEVDLAQAFDLSRPGRYRVEPRIHLHDHEFGEAKGWPRPRDAHQPLSLACPEVEFVVQPARRPPPGRGSR